MTNRQDEKGATPKNGRDDRLSEALRANLRRRKQTSAGNKAQPERAAGEAMARRDRDLQPFAAGATGEKGQRNDQT